MKKSKKSKSEISAEEVSANEATGSLQRIVPDPEELKKFNKEYNKK